MFCAEQCVCVCVVFVRRRLAPERDSWFDPAHIDGREHAVWYSADRLRLTTLR